MIFSNVLILCVLLILNCTIVSAGAVDQSPESLTIGHSQYFDSANGSVIRDEEKGIFSADFRFEATAYQFGGIGSINGNFLISMHPYKDATASRSKKINNSDFHAVSRTTCSKAEYDQSSEQIITVSDGDIVCFSLDENRDKVFGDGYVKIKIISHTDSKLGPYADSMTFIYRRLE